MNTYIRILLAISIITSTSHASDRGLSLEELNRRIRAYADPDSDEAKEIQAERTRQMLKQLEETQKELLKKRRELNIRYKEASAATEQLKENLANRKALIDQAQARQQKLKQDAQTTSALIEQTRALQQEKVRKLEERKAALELINQEAFEKAERSRQLQAQIEELQNSLQTLENQKQQARAIITYINSSDIKTADKAHSDIEQLGELLNDDGSETITDEEAEQAYQESLVVIEHEKMLSRSKRALCSSEENSDTEESADELDSVLTFYRAVIKNHRETFLAIFANPTPHHQLKFSDVKSLLTAIKGANAARKARGSHFRATMDRASSVLDEVGQSDPTPNVSTSATIVRTHQPGHNRPTLSRFSVMIVRTLILERLGLTPESLQWH